MMLKTRVGRRPTAKGAENKVIYVPLPGAHGTDGFAYQVTDCLGYGPASSITTTLAEPSAAFVALPYASFSATVALSGDTTMNADLTTPPEAGTFSLHELMKSTVGGNLTVHLKGLVGLTSLSIFGRSLSAAGEVLWLYESEGEGTPLVVAAGGSGHAELWFNNGGSLTYRVQVRQAQWPHTTPNNHFSPAEHTVTHSPFAR